MGHGAAGWQSVASGLLGKASYEGGNATIVLGLALHFFIAFVMALVYVKASHRLPVLVCRPVLMGVLYGFVLYVVMNFVVVPLSAIGFHAPSLRGVDSSRCRRTSCSSARPSRWSPPAGRAGIVQAGASGGFRTGLTPSA